MKAALTYHSLDDSGSPISIPPEVFARHYAWLTGGPVRVLSLDQLAEHPDDGDDAVALTFDDGFRNVREAVERLLDHGMPVTMFVVTGRVGGTNDWNDRAQRGIPTLPLLDWKDLEQLTDKGLSVEAHSRSHAHLTTLSAEALDGELGGCQEDLRARLGVRSMHLAYPYGELNEAVEERAAAYFRYGHTTEFQCLTAADGALRLPRLDMYYFQAHGSLEAWGTRGFERRIASYRLRRTIKARVLGPRRG